MTDRRTVQLCSVLRQTLDPFWILLFEGRHIYQPWISPCLSVRTLQTHYLPSTLPSQSSSLLLTWCVSMEAVFYSVQGEGKTELYASQVLTLVLMTTLVWHNVSRQPSCPRDTENKYTQSNHLKISTDQPFVLLVVKSREQMIHAVGSFFHLYWMPSRNRCWRTALRLLLDGSIKSLHSIAAISLK